MTWPKHGAYLLLALAVLLSPATSCSRPPATQNTHHSPGETNAASSVRVVPASTGTTATTLETSTPAPDAGTTDQSATDCTPPASPSLADCRALLTSPGVACDSGFRPARARFVHCKAGDLLCAIRQPAWDHAPVYDAAPPRQAASCLAECERGNGASCMRAAKAFGSAARASKQDDLPKLCAAHFWRQACRLGLPYACDDHPTCAGQFSRRQAFEKLEASCNSKQASWECFYVAHSLEMVWGAGPVKDRRAAYRRVCASHCPAAPRRCYKTMACQVLKLTP